MSLRARMTLVATVILAATLVVAAALVVALVEREVTAQAEKEVAEALAEQASALEAVESDAVVEVDDDVGFGVFRREGELAFGSLYVDGVEVAVVELNLTTGDVNELRDPTKNAPLDDPSLRADLEELSLVIGDTGDGDTVLVGAPSPGVIDVSTAAARRALAIALPVLVALGAWLTWWLTGRTLRPVGRMTSAVDSIAGSNLHERVPVPAGSDEITRLADTLNRMLERLERDDARLRHFSADVSHELRTPLATVRMAAEVAARDPDNAERALAAAIDEVDRMDALIDDLMVLASEESSGGPGDDTTDLAAVCQAVSGEHLAVVVGEGPMVVRGSELRLTRVISNLVDNAIRHAENEVRVVVSHSTGQVTVAVHDDGPGVPPADRERVFERLVRLDDARARDDGGAGLGLAFVDAIVRTHGGSVTVDDSVPLGGACFVVSLPGAGPDSQVFLTSDS